jgi:hypothetical protein
LGRVTYTRWSKRSGEHILAIPRGVKLSTISEA